MQALLSRKNTYLSSGVSTRGSSSQYEVLCRLPVATNGYQSAPVGTSVSRLTLYSVKSVSLRVATETWPTGNTDHPG